MDKFTAKSNWFQSAALLAARLWIAKTFFMSGLVKIKSWDSTIALFTDEYKVPVLPPEIAAYMATAAELSLPVLLVLGLMTPFAALGLFVMTLVIELFVYPGTTDHYHWMLLLGVLVTHGSGKLGADFWILKRFNAKA
ncbi:MAG: DoxX family protein [Alphaproteobacteria bacterium]|nr:DoxX family protein [Alphaproteobacteria bacterium]